ncbi:MAG TPA: Lrp/AsnC family transcriptional regulator [Candidatus Pullichristensenella excrementigallinarum]|uniref:Lrp/AsnC family transcriptional regulator n=1 Tax=Candidatus Pullichristensenella excrementigallinarum TaxID=2840907 RepID=A0A9D1IDD8_9FIRM|nr:Lrp/AsnC family transcriptional regulator [Candidatus Pullichristensenella excrementigallinarum]
MRKLEMSILQILTEDARTPADQIAIMLGKSEEEIRETIRRLEEQRIILKYPALINWQRVDVDEVEALIEVRVTPQRDHGFDAIAEQIYRFEEVRNVYLMSGGYDLLVMLKSQTLKKLALFVAEKLSTIDGVLSTATHFVLKRYKSQGVIMDERTEDRRLQVSP